MSGNADILKAVRGRWVADGLDWSFKQYWPAALRDEFPVVHNTEAGPGTPMPYCVFVAAAPDVAARMSSGPKTGGSTPRREQHDHPFEFHVHAHSVDGDSRTADEIAAALVDLLKQKFGGHPTVAPSGELALDNGGAVTIQYQTDYGVPQGDDEFMWVLQYTIKADVPVAI